MLIGWFYCIKVPTLIRILQFSFLGGGAWHSLRVPASTEVLPRHASVLVHTGKDLAY
jgi:hypothetical protein